MRAETGTQRRIVIDITDWNEFIFSGRPISGIQRVTLNLIRALQRLSLPHLVIRYDVISDCHRLVDPSFFNHDFSNPRAPSERGHLLSKDRYRNSRLGSFWTRLKFQLLRRRKRWKADGADCFRQPFLAADGDLLFVPGAGWEASATFEAAARWRRRKKLRVVVEIYDFIPFYDRYFHDRGSRRKFRRWLKHAAGIVDAYVLLSRFTESDFERFRVRLGIPQTIDTVVITPPHEFEGGDVARPVVVHSLLGRKRYALCVANIFSHKNGRRAVEAWRLLNLITDLELNLVIAGATSASEIERVFGKMKNVVIVEGPSDKMLANLYRHADFTIFPSLIEGWGMPVGESLWFGRPCLASNQTAIPEVGGDQCIYFDPNTPGELEQLVLDRANEPELVAREAERIDRTGLKSLDDYAEEVYAYLSAGAPSIASLNQQTEASAGKSVD